MPDRKRLVFTLWLTSSLVLLALLAFALVAPIRTSRSVNLSSRPDCLRRTLALPPGLATICRVAPVEIDDFLKLKAISSEDEEQDWTDVLAKSCDSFLIPWSFRNLPDRQPIARPSILSLYPLRC
ncbi:hypothetical protein EP7_004791 [Isosphaeraceae bacterium EP7]